MEITTWVLIVVGAALLLFELILPGGISFCVGLATLATAALYQTQIVRDPFALFGTWGLLSVAITSVGVALSRWLFGGQRQRGVYDEDVAAIGTLVQVRRIVNSTGGRIFFQGTEWEARTSGADIAIGEPARIVGRENITWIVEVAAEAAPQELQQEDR